MKGSLIVFLVLVLSAAIQCRPPGGGSDGGAPVNPTALNQELTADLIGPNGTFTGMGMDSSITNLLNGLIGPSGVLTPVLGGKRGGMLADVLRVIIAPHGILCTLFGKGGFLAGQSKLAGEILNEILGTKGVLAMIFGPNGLFGTHLEERSIVTLVQKILGRVIGFVKQILTGIVGPNGIVKRIFSSIFGPTGILGRIFGGHRRAPVTQAPGGVTPAPGGMTPAPGGETPAPGGMTPAPGGMTPAPGGMTPAPGGMTPAPGEMTPAPGGMTPAPGGDTSGGNAFVTGGNMDLDSAYCKIMPAQQSMVETSCLNNVSSTVLQGMITQEIQGLTCTDSMPAAGTSNSATWVPNLSAADQTQLETFVTCLETPA